MEIWKDLPRAPTLYQVSSLGNFKAKAKRDAKGAMRDERDLTLAKNEDGYLNCSLFIGGKQSKSFVHRLVYEAFHGPIPNGFEINHKNGIRSDNRPENLEALTHAENVRYSKEHLGADYATYGNGRMTPEQRELIFQLRANGMTFKAIGKHIGFSKSQVMNVFKGVCWAIES